MSLKAEGSDSQLLPSALSLPLFFSLSHTHADPHTLSPEQKAWHKPEHTLNQINGQRQVLYRCNDKCLII